MDIDTHVHTTRPSQPTVARRSRVDVLLLDLRYRRGPVARAAEEANAVALAAYLLYLALLPLGQHGEEHERPPVLLAVRLVGGVAHKLAEPLVRYHEPKSAPPGPRRRRADIYI